MSNLKDIATQMRRDIVRMVHAVQSGHPGGSLGCAEYFTALYFDIMKHNPDFKMDGIGEDLFFLSNGHISPVFYSALARSGYFPVEELNTFRKIRVASGSLGQGMSVAIGAALAKKLNSDENTVYSLHGDGELDEGQNWEAIMFAGAKGVDNLISTIDWNGQQIDGTTQHVLNTDSLHAKFEAFNWVVMEMEGNDMDAVVAGLQKAKALTGKGKPVVILMKTIMGKGVDFMEGKHEWHGTAPNDEQLKQALAQLPETLGDY
jgi:transketolase